MEVNIHEAKTQLSRLLRRVAEGEEITIARAGVPVAKLVAAGPVGGTRPMGMDQGKFSVPDDFDRLPPEVEALFYAPLPGVTPSAKREPQSNGVAHGKKRKRKA